MSSQTLALLSTHSRRPILIDTNILLLLFVGWVEPGLISKSKRTSNYSSGDFELVVDIVSRFPGIVTTPHILTEFSNLMSSTLHGELYEEFIVLFRVTVKQFREEFRPSADIAADSFFAMYGLTDCAIKRLATDENHLVLTDDGKLSSLLHQSGLAVLNINHLRQNEWRLL